MKKRARTYLRRWTGLFLSVCMLLTAVSSALADEPGTPTDLQPFYGVYTGGKTYNEHSADSEPLGDLVLPADFELVDDKYYYGALELEFPHGEGGGTVTIKTGDITAEIDRRERRVDCGPDPKKDFYYEDCDAYGVLISIDDQANLTLDTGDITAVGQAVEIRYNLS